jgi:acetyl esterase/lipase
VISVDYRLTTDYRWPVQIQDVDRAIRWIKAHASDWRLDAKTFVIPGGSAGGHLALFAAVAPGHIPDPDLPPELRAIDPRVSAVVALAAPADVGALLPNDWGGAIVQRLLGCSFDCTTATIVDASPSTHVTPSAPPAYLAGGANDDLVVPSVNLFALAAAWAAATEPRSVWVDLVDNQGHNLDVNGVNVTALDEFLSFVVSR